MNRKQPWFILLFLFNLFFLNASLIEGAELGKEEFNDPSFILTPRVWFSKISNLDEPFFESSEDVFVPLYGGTVTFIPTKIPNWNFSFTALYGEGTGNFLRVLESVTLARGTQKIERTDIELLSQYNIPGRNFYLLFGGRYVKFDTTKSAGSFWSKSDGYNFGAELGFGLVADITEDGEHRAFGNFLLLLVASGFEFKDSDGFRGSDESAEIGFDTYLGYQWLIQDFANIAFRYRLFLETQTNDRRQEEVIIVYGPEITVGFVF